MRDTSKNILTVAQWSFTQQLFSARTLGMAIVGLTPLLVAIVYRFVVAVGVADESSGFSVFSTLTAAIAVPFVAPMLALFYGSGVVTDDVEAGVMRYILTRPIPRRDYLLGRMIGNFVMVLLLFTPAFVLSYYLSLAPSGWSEIGRRFPTLLQDVLATTLGLWAYLGLFSFAGAALKRPLLLGLLYAFGWQSAASIVPGAVRYLTVTHYLHSLLPHETVQSSLHALFGERSSFVFAVGALVLIGLAAHAAAIWLFSRKEIL